MIREIYYALLSNNPSITHMSPINCYHLQGQFGVPPYTYVYPRYHLLSNFSKK